MNAIRIQTQVDSDTLHLPELAPLVGKTVEIIILDQTPSLPSPVETVDTFLGSSGPPALSSPADLDALRRDPHYERFWPLLDVVGQDVIDVDAIVAIRAASPI